MELPSGCLPPLGSLTHSLIIFTDSYINLYKILDISLGIIHLHTQNDLRKLGSTNDKSKLDVRLFGRTCTYQFKRLPVIGTFVNGLFLAALLVSAAIEGIQTCFHASHLAADSETSILLEHPFTYPGILVGFALVGLLMQWSSDKVHQLREEELESESLLDIRRTIAGQELGAVRELSALQLDPACQTDQNRSTSQETPLDLSWTSDIVLLPRWTI